MHALEWPIVSMSPHVISQVALGSKGLVTLRLLTDERFFTRVDSHVSFKVASLCESLCASIVWTLKGFHASL